jgi:CDP-diacylglycerol--serine O-phosphatidyltransferase
MPSRINLFTVPNIITCFGLLCGCVGIVLALDGATQSAMVCLLLAALLDFLDGFAARLLKAYSPVGKQLDSLADMVSFGALPAVMLSHAVRRALGAANGAGDGAEMLLVFSPFLLTVFSALRLAKFNIDERQSDGFLGLPTPANALFFSSAAVICMDNPLEVWTLLALVVAFSFLLVCEIPMFSFKVKLGMPAKYTLQLVFVLLSGIIMLLCLLYSIPLLAAFAPVILLYILMNVAVWIVRKFAGLR